MLNTEISLECVSTLLKSPKNQTTSSRIGINEHVHLHKVLHSNLHPGQLLSNVVYALTKVKNTGTPQMGEMEKTLLNKLMRTQGLNRLNVSQ